MHIQIKYRRIIYKIETVNKHKYFAANQSPHNSLLKMGTHIFIRLPQMIFSAICTGIAMRLLFPRTEDDKLIWFFTEDQEYDYFITRSQFIFAGICVATWMAYRSFP